MKKMGEKNEVRNVLFPPIFMKIKKNREKIFFSTSKEITSVYVLSELLQDFLEFLKNQFQLSCNTSL